MSVNLKIIILVAMITIIMISDNKNNGSINGNNDKN